MKIGRNQLCNCGSNKKYKHCCGKEENKIVDFLEAQADKEKNSIPDLLMQFVENEYFNEFILYLKKLKYECPRTMSEIVKDAENILFLESFIMHNKLNDGETIIEKFIAKSKRNFREVTITWLEYLKTIKFSLYEIIEVDKEKGEIKLKDVLREGIKSLKYASKYRNFDKGQAIWCQLIPDENYYQPFLSIYYVDVIKKDRFLKSILNLYKESNLNINSFLTDYSFKLLKVLIDDTDEFAKDYVSDREKHMFSIFWLHYKNSKLGGLTPLEALDNPHYKSKLEKILNSSEQGTEEDLMFSLCKSIICEHLGWGSKKLAFSEDYLWPKGQYKKIANLLEEKLKTRYTTLQIANTIKLWHDFLQKSKPRIIKPMVWVAVLDYTINIIESGPSLTQKQLAKMYELAPSTVSNRYIELVNMLKINPLDPRYSSFTEITQNVNNIQEK
ncbi:SEC-C motif-containing protein [Desulfonispora thiosulfatigenes DSM 11270]|uniref:SEC-C motif-containing protein n=1 Tax=Desulfonispora thiosulfatigenes DSM 11270 TaxID=656914 RepID=A0A1W1UKQ6_DESTI|nr:SEC-C domain-containing protein [Desulfonispora thiosulfatigenes]SMB81676.1 SEC-C motif-containing protein [Desulfonispora thiosulfatigenes DSM 11270]